MLKIVVMETRLDWYSLRSVRVETKDEQLLVRTAKNGKRGRVTTNVMIEYLVSTVNPRSLKKYTLTDADSALFRTFAELSPKPKAVEQFAKRHGFLGVGEEMPFKPLESTTTQSPRRSQAIEYKEELSRWRTEMAAMGNMVELWDLIARKSTSELRKVIAFDKRRQAISYRSTSTLAPQRSKQRVVLCGIRQENEPVRFPPTLRRDVLAQASYVLAAFLNDKLQDRMPSRLSFDEGSFRLEAAPTNLIDALWSQFASAVVRGARFRVCPNCEEYFEYGSKHNKLARRVDARFCTDNCRVRASEHKLASER